MEQEEAEEEEQQEEDEAEDDKEKEQEKEQMQEKQAWAPKTSAENTYLLRFCIRHRADAQHNRQQAENALRQDNDHAGPVIKIAHHADESSSKKRCRPTERESMAKRDEDTTEDITRSWGKCEKPCITSDIVKRMTSIASSHPWTKPQYDNDGRARSARTSGRCAEKAL